METQMSAFSSLPVRRLSVDEVSRMVQVGVLREDERVELLDGVLVSMSPQGPEHASRVAIVAARLAEAFGDGYCVREEKPLAVGDLSQPEPDLAVIKGRHEDYEHHHPTAADCALVIELAATSLETDRGKAELYARGGVAAYLLVDLIHRRLIVHQQPNERGYGRVTDLAEEDSFELPGSTERWSVASMLPGSEG